VVVLLSHLRRRVVYVAITEHPTPASTAQQGIGTLPNDTAPKCPLGDRHAIYSDVFQRPFAGMGITEVISSPSSPPQNPYVERLMRPKCRECLDQLTVLRTWIFARDPPFAIKAARILDLYGRRWDERPLEGDDFAAMKRLPFKRASGRIPPRGPVRDSRCVCNTNIRTAAPSPIWPPSP